MKHNQIIEAIESPHAVEALYRANRDEFKAAFPAAFAEQPDSPVLQVWQERLFFSDRIASDAQITAPRWHAMDIGLCAALSFAAGTLVKLPHFFTALDDNRFYVRNLAGILAGALILHFLVQKRCRIKPLVTITFLLLAALAYLNLLPNISNSDTSILACLHMPLFFWSLLGIAFLGGAWRDLKGRMTYLRYNGELLIYSTMILIGGMVLTGLTFALFELIDMSIEAWYLQNVVVYGAIASPIVATLLITRIVGQRFKMAPLLARVFTPLFLLTALAYLLAMAVLQKSPFTDRDFLIAFNGLLVLVLGLCVFSISERGASESAGVVDMMNIALVSVTLVIDVIALGAILFRLSSYGFTPNRVAVLGANLLAFAHLAGIAYYYLQFARAKSPFDALGNWVVRFIPAYTLWSLVVAVGLPLLFRFA